MLERRPAKGDLVRRSSRPHSLPIPRVLNYPTPLPSALDARHRMIAVQTAAWL